MPRYDDDEKMNPTNLAGARRLLADPDALDRALEGGLGTSKRGLAAKGFSEAEIRDMRRRAGGEDR